MNRFKLSIINRLNLLDPCENFAPLRFVVNAAGSHHHPPYFACAYPETESCRYNEYELTQFVSLRNHMLSEGCRSAPHSHLTKPNTVGVGQLQGQIAELLDTRGGRNLLGEHA